jgi:histone H3/H4
MKKDEEVVKPKDSTEDITEVEGEIEESDISGLDDDWDKEEYRDVYSLVYKNRLRELMKSIATHDEMEDIRFSKTGIKSLQESIAYLSVVLTFEIIETLKKNKRKTIGPKIVDEALTNMMGKADALGIAIIEVQNLVERLQQRTQTTSIVKATDFINLIYGTSGEEK